VSGEKRKVSLNFKTKISPLLTIDSLRVDDMISLINDNKLYGFALVDFKSTERSAFFNSINWGPIYKKIQVEFEMLPSWIALPAFDFEPKLTNWACIYRFMGLCKILLRV
jgi:hypothetical protein